MNSIQQYIQNSIREVSQFTMNDVLVNCTQGKIVDYSNYSISNSFTLDFNGELKTIILNAENNYKEAGILPICLSHGILKWNVKNKVIETPIFLFPLTYKKNKILQKIEFQLDEYNVIFNPFISNYFHQNFQIEIPNFVYSTSVIEEFFQWILSQNNQYEVNQNKYIGNFHHHRFQLVKDLEALNDCSSINPNVQQILGDEAVKTNYQFTQTKQILFPSDNDHLAVFDAIQTENCVIQGPPGTGKSQVLSNIIGKSMFDGHSTLIVSEKRVALEVLQKKLAAVDLNDFMFVTTTETITHDFLQSLEQTWNKLDYYITERISDLRLSEQHKDYLQLQLNLLSKSELVGGVTFDEFHQLSKEIEFKSSEYFSDVPYINDWQNDKEIIKIIYENGTSNLLQFVPFHFMKNSTFETLDRLLIDWKNLYQLLKNHFQFNCLFELDICIKKAAVCQFILNESTKSYFKILEPYSSANKKYLSLKKRYLKAKNELEKYSNEPENWNEFPTENETNFLLNSMENGKFLERIKAKRRIKKLVKNSYIDFRIALQNWKKYLEQKQLFSLLKNEFCEIGVNQPEIDVTIIDHLLAQVIENDWKIFVEMANEDRKNYSNFHSELAKLKSIFKSYFSLNEKQNFDILFDHIETYFPIVIQNLKSIQSLNEKSYKLISKTSQFDAFEKIIFNSNWINFERYFPELAQFKPEQIGIKLNQIIQTENEEFELFSKQIQQRIANRYQNYQRILQTTTARLSDEEKELKKRLKKGKSILVKEFAKTRSHPSIRELLQTEAKEWIELFKPIWLSNPVQISNCFPMKENLFDLVVFDEASQIPMSNALGSIQRGKRIIIAGDEQQMSPSLFFKSGIEEPIDLLHQAGYYWKKIPLKHHYRSEHPELIEFSNRHFYNNALVAYPAAERKNNPIQYHFCEEGRYLDNQNEIEALKIIELIENKIQNDSKDTIGIVAFSQTQLNCIWSKMSNDFQSIIQERIENNTLFFKSLENVQGEECDHLIISLGYGKNLEDEFHMRFGPINQKNGSKRLNVLFSRAKKSMDYICSVHSTDFKLTANESIRLLKLFLSQIENSTSRDLIQFPYHLNPNINGHKVQFQSIIKNIQDVNELLTLHRVLKNRGWEISYS